MRIARLLSLFLLATSLFYATSCHKSSTDAPTISITSPTVDENFANDLPIVMKGEVTDAYKLHALTITITDDKTGAVLFTKSPVVHDLKTYTFNETWVAKVTDWVDATVTVVVENHDDIKTTKSVKIKIWL